jgi:ribosome-interacting GTPase 1
MNDEGDVKKKIKRVLKKYGIWNTAVSQQGYNQPGVPDYIACVGGRLVGIEAKFGNRKPTAMQERQMREIEQSGGVTFVVNDKNIDEFESRIYTLLEREFGA